jgi:2-keto-3-deoxy-6-phosphogluconate aldolase
LGAEVPAGEGLLDEATAVDLALQAGAQFIVAPPTLAVALHRHETPTLPHFTSLSHLQQANPTNWSLLQASHLSPQDVLEWHTAVAGTQLIINTDPNSLRQVAAYRLAGAIALAVPLWQTGQDTIRPSIVKARAMSTAWQEAVKHGRD